jgi:hypothetical protein
MDNDDLVIILNQINLALSLSSYRLEQIENRLAEQNEILQKSLIAIAVCIQGGNNGKKE